MTSTEYRVSEAADLLGVSDETVRRWAADGRLALREGDGGSKVVDGSEAAGQPSSDRHSESAFHATERMRSVLGDRGAFA